MRGQALLEDEPEGGESTSSIDDTDPTTPAAIPLVASLKRDSPIVSLHDELRFCEAKTRPQASQAKQGASERQHCHNRATGASRSCNPPASNESSGSTRKVVGPAQRYRTWLMHWMTQSPVLL